MHETELPPNVTQAGPLKPKPWFMPRSEALLKDTVAQERTSSIQQVCSDYTADAVHARSLSYNLARIIEKLTGEIDDIKLSCGEEEEVADKGMLETLAKAHNSMQDALSNIAQQLTLLDRLI